MSIRCLRLLAALAVVSMGYVSTASIVMAQASSTSLPRPLAIGPVIIGHRGASGHLPEHTLESYALAIDLGADFIEPDLVSTKDHVLIARHENELSDTTDVEAKFPDRKRAASIDGRPVVGWFSEDFTLAEIKTLRARERLPFRNKANDGKFGIPTFQEIIELAKRKGNEMGRTIGLYPETKHSHYFRNLKLPLEEPLLAALERNGLNRAGAPVFIQSFEVANLKALAKQTPVALVQLIGRPDGRPFDFTATYNTRTYADIVSPEGLKEVATYAEGIGPEKSWVLANVAGTPAMSPLVQHAHAAGLLVHPYTFRNEERFLAKEFSGDPQAEYLRFFALGVDGVFSDFPYAAVKARAAFLGR